MSYRVKLNVFEGPFDLLVYLIEHAEMSIYDIQISEIVKQYMEHVKAMQITDVNVSSEFMVLAAALLRSNPRCCCRGQCRKKEVLKSPKIHGRSWLQSFWSTKNSSGSPKCWRLAKNILLRSWKNRRRILRHIQESRTSISASISKSSKRLSSSFCGAKKAGRDTGAPQKIRKAAVDPGA